MARGARLAAAIHLTDNLMPARNPPLPPEALGQQLGLCVIQARGGFHQVPPQTAVPVTPGPNEFPLPEQVALDDELVVARGRGPALHEHAFAGCLLACRALIDLLAHASCLSEWVPSFCSLTGS